MAIIPLQNVTADFVSGPDATNGNTLVIFWGPMNGGDEGQPIGVYAFDNISWQFTGAPEGGQLHGVSTARNRYDPSPPSLKTYPKSNKVLESNSSWYFHRRAT